jgi:DNA adenine methylase
VDRPALKPPFAYYGGKTTLAPQIVQLLPAHVHYVEPFAGGLSVLLAKPRSECETVNDLDGDLVAFWRVLRDQPEDLSRVCRLTPHSRQELADSCDLDGAPSDLERARRVWVRLTQSRSNSMKPTGWRRSLDGQRSLPTIAASHAEQILAVAERLDGVSLESRDALEVIRDYGGEADVCLYVDPPYLGSTRASNYRLELTTDAEHVALADALHACKGPVVLSGYDAPLYESLFPDWHRLALKAPPAMSHDTGRVEVLWSNQPLGESNLFDLLDGGVA